MQYLSAVCFADTEHGTNYFMSPQVRTSFCSITATSELHYRSLLSRMRDNNNRDVTCVDCPLSYTVTAFVRVQVLYLCLLFVINFWSLREKNKMHELAYEHNLKEEAINVITQTAICSGNVTLSADGRATYICH